VLTLAALPWVGAQRDPEAAAIRLEGGTLDYRRLDRAAAAMAAVLERRGVGAGDRVALYCGNSTALPVALYGALRRAAVVAPISTASPPAEVAAALRALRIRLLVCDPHHAATAAAAVRLAGTGVRRLVVAEQSPGARDAVGVPALVEHVAVDPMPVPATTAALILATSGTTGIPRHALHTHGSLHLNARAVATEMLTLVPGDVQLGALPLAHSFGLSAVLNASLLAGASVALLRHFDASAAIRLCASEPVTVVQGVPTMLARLADAATRRPPQVRLCVISGAPLPEGLAARIHERLCPALLERYGMTEVSPLTVRRVPADGGEHGDVGLPLSGVVVRTLGGAAEGELEAAAPTMFSGYVRDRRGTMAALRDGFFRTGDLGRVGRGGRTTLLGRLKDVIVRGGNNVAASEVERVLEAHPQVVEAAVVGIPDADLGEEVAAAVVLRRGGGEATLAELEARCLTLLAAYKRPRRWRVVDRLPRTATGKVRKEAVRESLIQGG